MTVDGPVAAEPDDLAEALAAAVLAPRWLTTLSVPYDASQRRRDALRSLARRLAQEHEGAAYDPQEDAVFFPRGRPKRVAAGKAEKTSIVQARVVRRRRALGGRRRPRCCRRSRAAARRRCRPATASTSRPRSATTRPRPTRSRRSCATTPRSGSPRARSSAATRSRPSAGPAGLGVEVDWRVLDGDPRWRETFVDLFAGAASALGAFYAEGWVEPGWEVSRNNRLSISAGRKTRGSALGREGWEGLPREPAWLTWFGGRYREPVAAALADAPPPRRRLLRRPAPAPERRRAARRPPRPARRAAAGEAPPAPAPARAGQAAGLSRRSRSAVKPG